MTIEGHWSKQAQERQQEGFSSCRGAACSGSQDVNEGGWRAEVNNASGNSIQCLQSRNLSQALFQALGIYHKTRLSSLLRELDSSGRRKGFDMQCHPPRFCPRCFVSLGMRLLACLLLEGRNHLASFVPPSTQLWALGKVNAQ